MNKILKYWGEARGRVQQKKSPWKWVLFPLSIICCTGILFLSIKGMSDLQRHLMPADVIFSDSTSLGEFLMCIPLMLPSLFIGMMLSNFIVWCIPSARRVLDGEAKGIKGGTFKSSMRFLFIATMISMIILPVSLLGFFNYFYFRPNGVTLRPLFSVKEKHYDWGDIVRTHGKFWNTGNNEFVREYSIYMRDGKKLDLVGQKPFINNVSKFLNGYEKIKPFLRAQSQISRDYVIEDTRMFKNPYSETDKKFIRIIQSKD